VLINILAICFIVLPSTLAQPLPGKNAASEAGTFKNTPTSPALTHKPARAFWSRVNPIPHPGYFCARYFPPFVFSTWPFILPSVMLTIVGGLPFPKS